MNIRSALLQASSPSLAECPDSPFSEFAFIGRSNVGKSSLINALTRKDGLARVSSTPGKTQLIHFFTVNDAWTLVDLPGYGYAKVAKKKRATFRNFVSDYLMHRENLIGTFVLIDSRLTPQAIDLEFLGWMVECGLPFILVFTKTDKISETEVQANIERFLVELQTISPDEPVVLRSSAKKGLGRAEILHTITSALAEDAEEPSVG